MESVWRQYLKIRKSKELKDGAVLDTVVIGGGIAGISVAYTLAKSGHKVTLIEAHKFLEGVTASTTAKLTALQSNYQNIPTKRKRRLYFESQREAVDGIEKLVREHNIDCDFEHVDSYVYGAQKQIEKEYRVMRKFCPQLEHSKGEHLPFGVHDCIRLRRQAQFNPIKYCYGLIQASNFDIIENCRIKKVNLCRKKLVTEDKTFRYNRLVIATGFPIVNIRGIYSFKMYKSSSYAICAKTRQSLDGIYNAIADDGLMYRDCADGMIIDGFGHRTGKGKCDKYFNKLAQEGKKFGATTSYKWSANDCMTFDAVPYAGRALRFRKNVYVISGFGKWGMANSYVSAQIIDDLIAKRKNAYRRLFKPTRVLNVLVWPAFLWNLLQDGLGLLAGLFSGRKRRCPHMGCRLKYNKNTQTYDCPCHGSRFTKEGDIIVSPAVDAIDA